MGKMGRKNTEMDAPSYVEWAQSAENIKYNRYWEI